MFLGIAILCFENIPSVCMHMHAHAHVCVCVCVCVCTRTLMCVWVWMGVNVDVDVIFFNTLCIHYLCLHLKLPDLVFKGNDSMHEEDNITYH